LAQEKASEQGLVVKRTFWAAVGAVGAAVIFGIATIVTTVLH
jgi:hypothetical protein